MLVSSAPPFQHAARASLRHCSRHIARNQIFKLSGQRGSQIRSGQESNFISRYKVIRESSPHLTSGQISLTDRMRTESVTHVNNTVLVEGDEGGDDYDEVTVFPF